MKREIAIKKLGRILGKSLGYRVDPTAPDHDDREEARAKLVAATANRKTIGDQMEARRSAILQADAEYQQLKAAYTEAKKGCDALLSITCRYRFTAGVSNSLFFHVKAQGDSWEDVIAQLEKKR